MLNGIGGRTIAEAKAAMTLTEANVWAAYRSRRGNLNGSLRLEQGFAEIRADVRSFMSGKAVNPTEFMPHVATKPADESASIEDVFAMFQNIAKANDGQEKPVKTRSRARRQHGQ